MKRIAKRKKNEELTQLSAKRRKLKDSKSFLINGDSIHVCIIIKLALEKKENENKEKESKRQMMKSQVSVVYSTTGSGHSLESG